MYHPSNKREIYKRVDINENWSDPDTQTVADSFGILHDYNVYTQAGETLYIEQGITVI